MVELEEREIQKNELIENTIPRTNLFEIAEKLLDGYREEISSFKPKQGVKESPEMNKLQSNLGDDRIYSLTRDELAEYGVGSDIISALKKYDGTEIITALEIKEAIDALGINGIELTDENIAKLQEQLPAVMQRMVSDEMRQEVEKVTDPETRGMGDFNTEEERYVDIKTVKKLLRKEKRGYDLSDEEKGILEKAQEQVEATIRNQQNVVLYSGPNGNRYINYLEHGTDGYTGPDTRDDNYLTEAEVEQLMSNAILPQFRETKPIPEKSFAIEAAVREAVKIPSIKNFGIKLSKDSELIGEAFFDAGVVGSASFYNATREIAGSGLNSNADDRSGSEFEQGTYSAGSFTKTKNYKASQDLSGKSYTAGITVYNPKLDGKGVKFKGVELSIEGQKQGGKDYYVEVEGLALFSTGTKGLEAALGVSYINQTFVKEQQDTFIGSLENGVNIAGFGLSGRMKYEKQGGKGIHQVNVNYVPEGFINNKNNNFSGSLGQAGYRYSRKLFDKEGSYTGVDLFASTNVSFGKTDSMMGGIDNSKPHDARNTDFLAGAIAIGARVNLFTAIDYYGKEIGKNEKFSYNQEQEAEIQFGNFVEMNRYDPDWQKQRNEKLTESMLDLSEKLSANPDSKELQKQYEEQSLLFDARSEVNVNIIKGLEFEIERLEGIDPEYLGPAIEKFRDALLVEAMMNAELEKAKEKLDAAAKGKEVKKQPIADLNINDVQMNQTTPQAVDTGVDAPVPYRQ